MTTATTTGRRRQKPKLGLREGLARLKARDEADPISVLMGDWLLARNIIETAILARRAGEIAIFEDAKAALHYLGKSIDEQFTDWQPTDRQRERRN